jgi:hypothetical protein
MFELVAGVKRGSNEDMPRYVRWSLFDKGGAANALACWLDRRTGRLVYQPGQMDPNAPG